MVVYKGSPEVSGLLEEKVRTDDITGLDMSDSMLYTACQE